MVNKQSEREFVRGVFHSFFFPVNFLIKKKMSDLHSNQDIKMSSAPFEPHTNAKKRKITHSDAFQKQSSTFEDELMILNESMDQDIKCKIYINCSRTLFINLCN